jgi:hypothetical protein
MRSREQVLLPQGKALRCTEVTGSPSSAAPHNDFKDQPKHADADDKPD